MRVKNSSTSSREIIFWALAGIFVRVARAMARLYLAV